MVSVSGMYTSHLWSDWYHLNQQCMYNVSPFLCSPGQLGL